MAAPFVPPNETEEERFQRLARERKERRQALAERGLTFGESLELGILGSSLGLLGGLTIDDTLAERRRSLEEYQARVAQARELTGTEKGVGTILRENVGQGVGFLAAEAPAFMASGGLIEAVGLPIAVARYSPLAARVLKSGGAFAFPGAGREILRQVENGQYEPAHIAIEAAKEFAVGGSLGLAGSIPGRGIVPAAARFGAEAAAFATVPAALEGRAPNKEDLISSVAMVGVFRALGLRRSLIERRGYAEGLRAEAEHIATQTARWENLTEGQRAVIERAVAKSVEITGRQDDAPRVRAELIDAVVTGRIPIENLESTLGAIRNDPAAQANTEAVTGRNEAEARAQRELQREADNAAGVPVERASRPPEAEATPPPPPPPPENAIELPPLPPPPPPPGKPVAKPPAATAAKPPEKPAEIPGTKAPTRIVVQTGQKPRNIEADYELVEADSIIASHHPETFAKNPRFPEGIQEREYHTGGENYKNEQLKVARNADNFDAAQLYTNGVTAVDGPPIVGPSGIVYGGNGRTMMVQRIAHGAARTRPVQLKQATINAAAQFGLDAGIARNMEAPIIIRRLRSEPAERAEQALFMTNLNRGPTQEPPTVSRAVMLSKNLSAQTIEILGKRLSSGDDVARTRDALRADRTFARSLQNDGIISQQEQSRFITKDGTLTKEGLDFVENVLVGRAIGDAEIINAMPGSLRQKVLRAVPATVLAEVEGKPGVISKDLRDAVATYNRISAELGRAKLEPEDVSDFMMQISTEPSPAHENPRAARVLETFLENPNTVGKKFDEYAKLVQKVPASGQGELLQGLTLTEREAFDAVFGAPIVETRVGFGTEQRKENAGLGLTQEGLNLLREKANESRVRGKAAMQELAELRYNLPDRYQLATAKERGLTASRYTIAGEVDRQLTRMGQFNPIGLEVRDPLDVAIIAQPIRNPGFENLVFMALKDGKVVGVRHHTSRLPNQVSQVYVPARVSRHVEKLLRAGKVREADEYFVSHFRKGYKDVLAWADRAKADEVVWVHNHPSGWAHPSKGDLSVGRHFYHLDNRFRRGIILDHEHYTLMDAKVDTVSRLPKVSMMRVDKSITMDGDLKANPVVPSDLIGKKIGRPTDFMSIASELQSERSIVMVFANTHSRVTGVEVVPEGLFRISAMQPSRRGQGNEPSGAAYMRGRARMHGAASVFAHYEGKSPEVIAGIRSLWEQGKFTDAALPLYFSKADGSPVVLSLLNELGGTPVGKKARKLAQRADSLYGTGIRKNIGLRQARPGEDLVPIVRESVESERRRVGRIAESHRQVRETGRQEADRIVEQASREEILQLLGYTPEAATSIVRGDPAPIRRIDGPEGTAFSYSTRAYTPGARVFVEGLLESLPGTVEARRRGRISQEELNRLAQRHELTVEDLADLRRGSVLNAEELRRALGFIEANTQALREASGRALEAGRRGDRVAKEAAEVEQEALAKELLMLEVVTFGVKSELGRAMGVLSRTQSDPIERTYRKAVRTVIDANHLTALQQERLLKNLVLARGDRVAIRRAVKQAYKPSLWDMFVELRVMFLLSSPATQLRNIGGNTMAVMTRMAEVGAGVPIDAMYSLATGRPRERSALEAAMDGYGMFRGLQDGIRNATRALRDEDFAITHGRIGSETGQITTSIPGRPGEVVRVPGRFLSAMDLFYSSILKSAEAHRLGARQALSEGRVGVARYERAKEIAEAALRVPDARVEVAKRTLLQEREAGGQRSQQLSLDRETEIAERTAGAASLEALEFTFREQLPSALKTLDSLRFRDNAGSRMFRVLVPFLPTPINIARFTLRRAPILSAFSNAKMLAGNEGRARMIEAWSRMTVGTALFTGAVTLALEGFISGNPPNDRAARDQKEATGWQPWSVKLDDGRWYSYRGFSPMTEILAMAAQTADAWYQKKTIATAEFAQQVGLGVAQTMVDQPYFTAFSDLVEALTDRRQPGDRVATLSHNLISGTVIPRGFAFLARALDPQLRAFPETLIGKLEQDWPGTRDDTIPYRDNLGRSHESTPAWLNAVVRNRKARPITPEDAWLADIQEAPDRAVIGFPVRRVLGRRLSSDEYDEIQAHRWAMLQRILPKARVALRNATDTESREQVRALNRKVNERARLLVIPRAELQYLGLEDTQENRLRVMRIMETKALRDAYEHPARTVEEKRGLLYGRFPAGAPR